MGSFAKYVIYVWNVLQKEAPDKRTRGWFLTGSPIPPILLLIFYYQLVRKIGPAVMESRKPYNIDKIIQVYNVIQIFLNGWLAFESFRITFGPNGTYSWTCQPIDKSMSPVAVKVATFTWIYYMIKLFDLFDTIFFVLRKKFNQATFLHVYHHIGVTALGYIGTKYYPDGQGFILVPLNSFVHCFMYSYYFLTNYNSEYKKKIWWKKYITQIQIIQFLILLYQTAKVFFLPWCEYPWIPVCLLLPQNILMLILFGNFYQNAYLTPKKSLKVE